MRAGDALDIYSEPWNGAVRTGFIHEGRGLTWQEVASGLQDNGRLRTLLTQAIRTAPHTGLFWECVPVSRETSDRVFQFVTVPSAQLEGIRPRWSPFARQLAEGVGTEEVRIFQNIGGDAVLVAPCLPKPDADYAHLLRFLRNAPEAQIHGLWAAVGRSVEQWWAQRETPVWVSTSGLGVHWLHVRLDERPKYVTWQPYRKFP